MTGPLTWLRTADADEASFFALVAGEAGCTDVPAVVGVSLTRVVTSDGQVSGFYRVRHDDRWNAQQDTPGDAVLDFVHVHGDRRRTGLGRLLVQDLHRVVGGFGCPGVRIVAHPPSEAFFRAVGASRIGTEPACAATGWARPVLRIDTAAAAQRV